MSLSSSTKLSLSRAIQCLLEAERQLDPSTDVNIEDHDVMKEAFNRVRQVRSQVAGVLVAEAQS